jgi:3-dehydro-L-gulonate 2-dehydrogenase
VFIAFDVASAEAGQIARQMAGQVIENLQSATRAKGESVRYPGQHVLETRKENMAQGIPIAPAIWEKIKAM